MIFARSLRALRRVSRFARLAIASWAFVWATGAHGDNYPTRPIHLISPYAPGGSNDIVTRILAQQLGEALRQPVIVENRPGGGMIIGTEIVARAPADGYTLILVSSGHAINPGLHSRLPYDTLKDFAAVSLIGSMPNVVVVYPGSPVNSISDLVTLARANPGGINYASAGNASTPHLAAELLKSVTGAPMTHIPYKGTGPALTDLVGGQVSLTICGIAPALPYIKAGKLRAIAVTGKRRAPLAPGLPTVAESGYPGYNVVTWYGVLAPAGTPTEIVRKLSATIASLVQAPDMRGRFGSLGMDPVGSTPEEFDGFIRAEISTWAKVIKTSGVKPE